jgi:3-oxoacyl-[acyl-carrier-protein] synthase II
MGMVSPLGANCEDSFAQALTGQGAVGKAPDAILKWLPNALAAVVPDRAFTQLLPQDQGLDRAVQLALIASREALSDAQFDSAIDNNELALERVGVNVGIGLAGAVTLDALYNRFYEKLHSGDPTQNPIVVHPLSVPRLMPNAAAAAISMANGFKGATQTYCVACASSAMAIGEAYRSIKHGYLDAVVVVGAEAMIAPGALIAWNALRVLAKPNPQNIAASCRPFSAGRNGFVMGEGAACLILESEEHAQRRGAKIKARLSGYATSSDAAHITAPNSDGQIRAMRSALEDAALAPQMIGYINAHGTATEIGDVVETQSIRAVFGEHADKLMVSSTKSMHGHLIGAGGTTELVLSIMMLNSGSVAPTAYLDKADPQCDLDYVPLVARHQQDIQAVMSNSFAFGGSNAVLIVQKPV